MNSMFTRSIIYVLSCLFGFGAFIISNANLPDNSIINTDSLIDVIKKQEDDTSKLSNLNLVINEYLKVDLNNARRYANQMMTLAKNLEFVEGEIDGYYNMANLFKIYGKYDSAAYWCKFAIQLSDSISDLKKLAKSTNLFGAILYRSEGPDSAKFYYTKSLSISNSIKDSVEIAMSLNGLGAILKRQGKYDSAVYYYLKVVEISEKINFQKGLGMGYINLGLIYHNLTEFEKAESYLLKSITINKELNNLNYLGISYSILGAIAYDKKDYNKALNLYKRALEINMSLDKQLGIANLNNNIGNIYEINKDYNKAFENYTYARSIFERIGNEEGIITSSKNQALIYERWGKYDKALLIYDTCLILANEINSLYRIREIYYNIYKAHELKSDFRNSFYYLIKHDEIKDSIFNLDKRTAIADLQLKYDHEKNLAHILSLEKENLEKDLSLRQRTNQRNIYLFTGSGIISIIFFLLIFYRHKARKDKIISETRILQLEEEKKLLAARSIVDGQENERKRIAKELHDGLGVLLSTAKMQFTSIKDKSPENRPLIEKATKLLEQAAGDVRKISHNMMPGLLTKFGLYEATEDLIEQLDETEGLNAKCEILGDTKRLAENTEIMLYRIFQELVNNTIKHAEATNITLKIIVRPELLVINYYDDGKGFNMDEKIESRSIGLTSIQSRVKFLSGKSSIESAPGQGTSYSIEIPI